MLDQLGCSGFEDTLLSCSHNGLNNNNCVHFEDASAVCSGIQTFMTVNTIKIHVLPIFQGHPQGTTVSSFVYLSFITDNYYDGWKYMLYFSFSCFTQLCMHTQPLCVFIIIYITYVDCF